MNQKMILMASMLLMVLVLPSVNAQSFPSWIQDMAGWYSDGSIDDAEYIKSLQFLIDEKIIKIPQEIVYVDVIKEVQAEPLADTHDEIWNVIEVLQNTVSRNTASNVESDIYRRLADIEKKEILTDISIGDLIIKFDCFVTKSCNGYQSNEAQVIQWESKYNELNAQYIELGKRVVELEKKEIERHDREVRTGEVQS